MGARHPAGTKSPNEVLPVCLQQIGLGRRGGPQSGPAEPAVAETGELIFFDWEPQHGVKSLPQSRGLPFFAVGRRHGNFATEGRLHGISNGVDGHGFQLDSEGWEVRPIAGRGVCPQCQLREGTNETL